MDPISYRRHRFPPIIIQQAVWLYYRFTLSYRDIEDLMAERGIDVSYETARRWATKFGRQYAKRLRHRRPRPSSIWHIDEVFVKIGGGQIYLWPAVDAECEVLDILLQSQRDKGIAVKFLRRLMKKHGAAPTIIDTDKWRVSAVANCEVVPNAKHMRGKRLNNRAENSHQPTRSRERKQQRFKSPATELRFLSTFSDIYNHFNIQRHLVSRTTMKKFRTDAGNIWLDVTTAAWDCRGVELSCRERG